MKNNKIIIEKLEYSSAKVQSVVNLCKYIELDYIKRIFYSSILISVEVYLVYISQLKNNLKEINKINKKQYIELNELIKSLNNVYCSNFF